MNIRQVLKAFTTLRQLTDDESALLETLRGLNDAERESLVVALQPEKTTTKRASKKSSKSASKSARASGMAAAINRSLSQRRETSKSELPCAHILPDDNHCMEPEDALIHDPKGGYVTSHDYVPPASRAGERLSTNGGAGNTTQNIETEKDAVGVAAGGSNE